MPDAAPSPASPTPVRTYLGGAVTVEALAGDAAAGRFRSADARGEVAFAARGEAFQHLHLVSFAAAGVRRGFHAHPAGTERLYVFSGAVDLLARAADGGETLSIVLFPGDLVTFAPGTAHGFVARGPAVCAAFGTGPDPLGDTVAVPDLAASA